MSSGRLSAALGHWKLSWPSHPIQSPLHPSAALAYPLGPPHKPFEPPPAALSLASLGRLPGQASAGPRWAQVDPEWRAGPRPVPGVCLQVHSVPHQLVSQDFSTQNTSPREATGLMSWACGRSHPALPVPPQSQNAVRGCPGRTCGPGMEPGTPWPAPAAPGMSHGGGGIQTTSTVGLPPEHPPWPSSPTPGFTLNFLGTLCSPFEATPNPTPSSPALTSLLGLPSGPDPPPHPQAPNHHTHLGPHPLKRLITD